MTPALVADCSRVQNVAQDDLGRTRGAIGGKEMIRIRIGIRSYLDVDRLVAKAGPRQDLSPRTRWWPEQGMVRCAEQPGLQQTKMYAFLSDDDWNSLAGTIYSAAVRLTSKTHPMRTRWEVEAPAGWVVAGHLYSVLHDDVDQRAPRPPRPSRLDGQKLSEIARLLFTLLALR